MSDLHVSYDYATSIFIYYLFIYNLTPFPTSKYYFQSILSLIL